MCGFRSTSSAKELDLGSNTPQNPALYLDPQAPRKSLTLTNIRRVYMILFRSTSSAKELDCEICDKPLKM